MHPNLLSARLQLADVESAFERLLEIETEVIDLLPESKAGNEAKTILRAAQIEDVYTGIERTLKEVLKVSDVHIYAEGGAWHNDVLRKEAILRDVVPLFLAEMTAFTDNYDPVPGNPRP